MLQTTLGMSAEAQQRSAARVTMVSVPGTQGCLPQGQHWGTFTLLWPIEAWGRAMGCPAAGAGES